MKRFWQYAEKEGGPNIELQSKWRESHCWRECLTWATSEWERNPVLTTTPISTHELQQEFSATERDAIEHINQSDHFKILRMIGSFACAGQWSEDLERACYRAARRNGQVRFHARGMLPSRHCYRACHLRVQLCYSFMQALLQSKL